MTWFTPEVIDVIITVLKAVVILLAVVVCGALLSWVERRLLALWQDRYGPNRVGPFGAFQIAADMIKMFFKEDWTPPFADKMIFTAGTGRGHERPADCLRDHPDHPDLGRGGSSTSASCSSSPWPASSVLCGAVRRLVEQQQVRPAGQLARLARKPCRTKCSWVCR